VTSDPLSSVIQGATLGPDTAALAVAAPTVVPIAVAGPPEPSRRALREAGAACGRRRIRH
jgi:hypothetical protein